MFLKTIIEINMFYQGFFFLQKKTDSPVIEQGSYTYRANTLVKSYSLITSFKKILIWELKQILPIFSF